MRPCFRIAATVNSDPVLLCECTCVCWRDKACLLCDPRRKAYEWAAVSAATVCISLCRCQIPAEFVRSKWFSEPNGPINADQKHLKYDRFCQFVCVQHGLDVGPRQRALLQKGGSTDCSASRGTFTHPVCCGESPNRSHSTSWMKTTLDRPEYATHLLDKNTRIST